MENVERSAVIKLLPQHVNAQQARLFLREMQPALHSDRPQIVLDLSQVRQMDAAAIDLLMHCMTEATKRDGDVKLAAPSPRAAIFLELTRMDRFFEVFESSAQAAASFGGGMSIEDVVMQRSIDSKLPDTRRVA